MGAMTLANAIIILIHGTWANESPWYLPGDGFFECLQAHVAKQGASVVPFCWSGNLNHASRRTAGTALVQLIKSYPADKPIVIIAHSHGGNVAIIASQILAKEQPIAHTIDKLYLLGTPAAPIYWRAIATLKRSSRIAIRRRCSISIRAVSVSRIDSSK